MFVPCKKWLLGFKSKSGAFQQLGVCPASLIFVNFVWMERYMKSDYQQEQEVEVLEAIETTHVQELIVFNDDFNTFDHVIETLVKVCKHTIEQAEQCTWLIHYRGKCTVKMGAYDFLKPMRDSICEAGIEARIY